MDEQKTSPQYRSIVVGLSGGLNSAVAAMLLKIQKIDLIAVTIDSGQNLGIDPDKNFACHLTTERMQQIKDFCHALNIPHYVISGADAFSEQVMERWMSQKICGAIKDQCFNCHKMRMAFLYEKMKELGAERMATGHFAKIYLNPTTQEVTISSANDETHDQSDLLANIPREILKHLVLPLSDLSMKEVLKLAENFSIGLKNNHLQIHQCFPESIELKEFLESKVAPSLRESGDIYDLGRTHHLGQHHGIHQLEFNKDLSFINRNHAGNNQYRMAKFSMRDKTVEMAPPSYFINGGCHLTSCDFQQGVDLSIPFKAYALINEELIECMVYPKNLSSVYVELEKNTTLSLGERVTIYKKKGKNSKVILSGIIKRVGTFHFVERTDDIENQADDKAVGVDHEKSF